MHLSSSLEITVAGRAGRPRKCPSPQMPLSVQHTDALRVHAVSTAEVFALLHDEESVWICTACEGHPFLRLTEKQDRSDCFRLWHDLYYNYVCSLLMRFLPHSLFCSLSLLTSHKSHYISSIAPEEGRPTIDNRGGKRGIGNMHCCL